MNRSGLNARRAASIFALGALTFGPVLAAGTVASAAPGEGVQLTLSENSGLGDGQKITVDGSGVDPELGYYLSTCVVGTSGPTGPECAGGPNDMAASAWVSNSPGATVPINPDGTFTAELRITRAGETMSSGAMDCDATPCAVTLFGDHRNGFVYTADEPITLGAAAAGTAPAAPATTEDSGTRQAAAESADDVGMNPAWWVVGGVVVVLLAGGGVAYSRKK